MRRVARVRFRSSLANERPLSPPRPRTPCLLYTGRYLDDTIPNPGTFVYRILDCDVGGTRSASERRDIRTECADGAHLTAAALRTEAGAGQGRWRGDESEILGGRAEGGVG